MPNIATYLRYLVQGDKEAKITSVTTHGDPEQYTSRLTTGQPRKSLSVYNNSDAASGEVLFGFTTAMNSSGEGQAQPIPRGAMLSIPVADESNAVDANGDNLIALYFMNSNSGERGNVRVTEIA